MAVSEEEIKSPWSKRPERSRTDRARSMRSGPLPLRLPPDRRRGAQRSKRSRRSSSFQPLISAREPRSARSMALRMSSVMFATVLRTAFGTNLSVGQSKLNSCCRSRPSRRAQTAVSKSESGSGTEAAPPALAGAACGRGAGGGADRPGEANAGSSAVGPTSGGNGGGGGSLSIGALGISGGCPKCCRAGGANS